MTLQVTNVVGTKSLLSFWLVKTKIHTTYQIEGKGSFYCHQISVVFGLKLKPSYRKLSVTKSKPKPIPTYHTCLGQNQNQHATIHNLFSQNWNRNQHITHAWVMIQINMQHKNFFWSISRQKATYWLMSESKSKSTYYISQGY